MIKYGWVTAFTPCERFSQSHEPTVQAVLNVELLLCETSHVQGGTRICIVLLVTARLYKHTAAPHKLLLAWNGLGAPTRIIDSSHVLIKRFTAPRTGVGTTF